MHDLLTGSMPSWLNAVAIAVSPLIALLVGFVGADQWLRWRLLSWHDAAPRGEAALYIP